MKYKCLVLDHDDTAVDSSREIHYPSFCHSLEIFRPKAQKLTLNEFMQACFYPGLFDYYTKTLGFSKEELELEVEMWKKYVETVVPHFYDGIGETILRFKDEGGIVAVSSQSHRDIISRDYRERLGYIPSDIYGYEVGEERCKPSPFAVNDLCKKYGFSPSDVIIVDDMRTGYEMARRAGAHFAAAGWSHFVPEIREFMQKNSEFYLSSPKELEKLLF